MHKVYYQLPVSYNAPTCFDVYTSSSVSFLQSMLQLQINKLLHQLDAQNILYFNTLHASTCFERMHDQQYVKKIYTSRSL
jgi:hypothetical protein